MPNENKKRGSRGRRNDEKKRQLEEEEGGGADARHHDKRRKTSDADALDAIPNLYQEHYGTGDHVPGAEGAETVFYGLLDEEEQEYFKRADDMLEVNKFADPEERYLFLTNLYKEAEGKELKLACSQSCSRLMERLILLSSPDQLKKLFQKFTGHFLNLVQHRFASHCCETLFTQSAPSVSQELVDASTGKTQKGPDILQDTSNDETKDKEDEVFVTMENLFLYAATELEGNFGFLMTDRFASHTLRVLLMVLAGQQVESLSKRSLLQSKRKENVDVVRLEKPKEVQHATRPVPASFSAALEKMIKNSVLGLDTNFLRALATHPTGNPTLQLLLQLELTHFGKSRAKEEDSIIRRLLPDDHITEGSQSASFINGLIYEAVGSRLLETIVEYSPGKMFKMLYRESFKERMGSLARNEIASYVVSKILERLSSEDLQTALDSILPQIPNLVERGRTAIIKTLAERCHARNVKTQPLADALRQACSETDGKTFSLVKFLQLPPSTANVTQPGRAAGNIPTLSTASTVSDLAEALEAPSSSNPKQEEEREKPFQGADPLTASSRLHASLLAQALLQIPGPLSTLIFDSLVALPVHTVLQIAMDPTASRTLQAALSSPHATVIFRRKLITRFYGHTASLSQHTSGSHVVDAILAGTTGIAFMRERIAEELAEAEATLRESRTGRMVWRNWKMDLYRRRRAEWVRQTRREAGNDGFLSFPEEEDDDPTTAPGLGGSKTAKAKVGGLDGAKSGTLPHAKLKGGIGGAGHGQGNGSGKTALQLAREKFARNKLIKAAQGLQSQPPSKLSG